MMWILTAVLKSPLWMKVGGVALLTIGVLQVRHVLEVRGLNGQIETLMAEIVAEQVARTDLILALSEVQTNRDLLTAELRKQNDAIAAVTVRAERSEALASVRATRLLQQGQLLADALRTDTGTARVFPGHVSLNNWMTERLP